MIDWHTHVLPNMDDGSHSLEESLEMLKTLAQQGVSTVVATPHFYANDDSIDSFLERRKKSYECLSTGLTEDCPRVVCGAEIAFYQGIAKLKDIKRLTVENTNLILLEMPIARWSESDVREIIELADTRGVKVMLAHVDRYMSLQEKSVMTRLLRHGVIMQLNASCFEGFFASRRALDLVKSGLVRFIGSDCHNMTSRPPRIGAAYGMISKKIGEGFVSRMSEYGYHILGDCAN